jgi:hypothetical protein
MLEILIDLLSKGQLFYLCDDGLHISIDVYAGNQCNEIRVLLKHLPTEDKYRARRR